MRFAAALAVTFALSAPVAAQDWDCTDTGNLPQMGLNYCAAVDYQAADRALNVAWPMVLEFMTTNDAEAEEYHPEQANGRENLLKAQRAWIDYRDGHCEAEGARYAGGSIRPLIESSCKAELTRKRTQELLLLIEQY